MVGSLFFYFTDDFYDCVLSRIMIYALLRLRVFTSVNGHVLSSILTFAAVFIGYGLIMG